MVVIQSEQGGQGQDLVQTCGQVFGRIPDKQHQYLISFALSLR